MLLEQLDFHMKKINLNLNLKTYKKLTKNCTGT